MKDGLRGGLEDGNVFSGFLRGKRRDVYPDDVAGFSFDCAFEQDAIFVGAPVENAEAYAQTDEMIEGGEVADFEDFAVDEIGDFFAAGGNQKSASVVVERSDFLVVLREKIEALETRGAGKSVIALYGDGCVGVRDAVGINEGAAFECGSSGAGGDVGVLEREKHARLHGFGEIDDRGVVLEPGGVVAVLDDAFAFAEVDFSAAVFESERGEGVFGAAVLVNDGGGEKLGEEHVAIRRPVEGIDGVGEEFVAAGEFVALEEFAALAVGVLEPDVVVLEVVLFGFDVAADGIDDATVGSEAEGGDFFVDILEGLVEVLGASARRGAAAHDKAD